MYRIANPTNVLSLPPPTSTTTSSTPGYFANPSLGGTQTTMTADWANMVQEEFMSILAAAGITPSDSSYNQVLLALQSLTYTKASSAVTFYVNASTGSDSANTGLSSGSPFATLQHAWNVMAFNYNHNGYTPTISVADGTYGPLDAYQPLIGASSFNLTGDVTTPANCIISCTSGSSGLPAVTCTNGATCYLSGFKLTGTGAPGIYANGGGGLLASNGTILITGNMNFGSAGGYHMASFTGGIVGVSAAGISYTISGGACGHMFAQSGGTCSNVGSIVTLTGTPAFSVAFANTQLCGTLLSYAAGSGSYTGSATGVRYSAVLNGVISTNSSGSTWFPGNSAGSVSNGGVYS